MNYFRDKLTFNKLSIFFLNCLLYIIEAWQRSTWCNIIQCCIWSEIDWPLRDYFQWLFQRINLAFQRSVHEMNTLQWWRNVGTVLCSSCCTTFAATAPQVPWGIVVGYRTISFVPNCLLLTSLKYQGWAYTVHDQSNASFIHSYRRAALPLTRRGSYCANFGSGSQCLAHCNMGQGVLLIDDVHEAGSSPVDLIPPAAVLWNITLYVQNYQGKNISDKTLSLRNGIRLFLK